MWNAFFKFTSGMTPIDLLMTNTATKLLWSTYFSKQWWNSNLALNVWQNARSDRLNNSDLADLDLTKYFLGSLEMWLFENKRFLWQCPESDFYQKIEVSSFETFLQRSISLCWQSFGNCLWFDAILIKSDNNEKNMAITKLWMWDLYMLTFLEYNTMTCNNLNRNHMFTFVIQSPIFIYISRL